MRQINGFLGRVFILAAVFTLHPSFAQGSGFTIADQGADYRVWQQATVSAAPSGETTTNVQSYTELATGLNYTNSSGQLTESSEQITLLPTGGAAAVQGQHQVYFPADIYNGVLEVVTPDGRHLYSRPLGVSYDDGSNSVFIATLKHAQGYLTSSNQVTYRDAFTDFKADLVCTYRLGGFECDLVFRQQPPTPAAYGLDASLSTLQMVTEFFNTQDPQQIPGAYDEWFGLQDSTLNFGKLTMTQGQAFAVKSSNSQLPSTNSTTAVYKQWLHLEGRTFLVEAVPLDYLADDLNALPLTAQNTQPENGNLKPEKKVMLAGFKSQVSGLRTFPPAPAPVADTNQILLASIDFNKEPGVVLDYQTINTSQNNYTFKGDTTYYLSGSVNLTGTTTFEGGTVIKYAVGKAINIVSPGIAQTTAAAYRPAVFTAKDDNSIGEIISGSSGSPVGYYASPALSLQTAGNPALQYVRFTWAQTAVTLGSALALNLANVQFVNCNYAVAAGDTYMLNLDLKNTLFAHVQTPFDMFNLLGGATFNAQQVTFDSCATLVREGYTVAYALNLTNCIVANVPNTGWTGPTDGHVSGNHNGAYNNPWNGTSLDVITSVNPFQAVGKGYYYLANGSSFVDAGSTAIDPGLLTSLRNKTTQPPLTTLTGSVLGQHALRDINTPDLGCHYEPLDYCLGAQFSSGTLTLTGGTAIGVYGSYGFQGGSLISDGSACSYNHIARYCSVQEQPAAWGANPIANTLLSASSPPAVRFHFTDVSLAGGGSFCSVSAPSNMEIKDCSLLAAQLTVNGGYGAYGTVLGFTNNIFERCTFSLLSCYGNPYYANFYNNLFQKANISLAPACGGTILPNFVFQNNLFVNGSFTYGYFPGYTPQIANNGYYYTTVTDPGAAYISITTLDFQNGQLGPYYYPLTGVWGNLSQLFDAGSMTVAAAGLATYTTRSDQNQDNGTVDIGYHYVSIIRSGFDQNMVPRFDDNYVGPINLPFDINFFGTTYSSLYVNQNGNVTFDGGISAFTPTAFADIANGSKTLSSGFQNIIAPFWADVDPTSSDSLPVKYGTGSVEGHTAFGVNWIGVGYFTRHSDKLNSFQMIIIARPDRNSGDYDIEFNFALIRWDAGDVSGGIDGLWQGPGGSSARVGYASASGYSFELNGSGASSGALLDSNPTTGLIHNSFNTCLPGRYIFQFHNGAPIALP